MPDKKQTKSTSPPKGRPEAEIDWALVDEMLKAQCPGTEIAEAHGIHPNTLYLACERENKMSFSEYSQQKRSQGVITARVAFYNDCWNNQTHTDPRSQTTKQIFWLKNHAGMADKVENTVTGNVSVVAKIPDNGRRTYSRDNS